MNSTSLLEFNHSFGDNGYEICLPNNNPTCGDPYFSLPRGSYGSIDQANQLQSPSNSTSKAGKSALKEFPAPHPHSSVTIYMHLTSPQSFNAGKTKGNTQAKVEEWTESIQDTTNAARDKTSAGSQSNWDSAQLERDQSAGFLQQTGEQVKHVAQDAMDSVKNTLGIGQNKK